MSKRIPLTYIAGSAVKRAYRRLAVDMGGPTRSLGLRVGRPSPFFDIKSDMQYGNPEHGNAILKGHFLYGGQTVDVGANGDPWSIALPSEDFAKWLHGFSWLEDLNVLASTNAAVRARFLLDRWEDVYGKWNPYSWQPDILSERLYNMLTYWSPMMTLDKLTEDAQIRRINVMRQLKRLRRIYKRTTPGLPRFQAAASIAMGGARIAERSDGFLDRGLDWLDDEIDAQILPDGGHISRSPQQTLRALEILLTLDKVLNRRGVEGTRTMGRAIDRLLPATAFFKASDGGLVSFNGGSAVSEARIAASFAMVPNPPKALTSCPHTGYQRAANGSSVLMMDTGSSPERPFDLEAHLAPLAMEFSTEAGRLFVNCGWAKEQPASWRRSMRSTAAHTTLTLGDRSAGELLAPGFASRLLGDAIAHQAGPARAARKDQAQGTWIEAAHDGYVKDTGLIHTRRLYVDAQGGDLRGEDSLSVPSGNVPMSHDKIPFDIRFHLHPSVRVSLAQDQKSALLIQPGQVGWRFRTDGGPLKLEKSAYMAEGHRPQKCEQIVISGMAFCDSDGTTRSNRVRWSLRRLKAHK